MIDKKTQASAGTGGGPLLLMLIVSAFRPRELEGSRRATGPVRAECSERLVWELDRRQAKSSECLLPELSRLESITGNISLLESMAKP